MRAPLIAALILPLALLASQVAARQEEQVSETSTRTLYLGLIGQARADGKPRAALAYLDDFERQHPDDREARILRVNCLLDLNQIEGARQALARIPADDRSAAALAVRGHVLTAQGQWGDAAQAYATAQAASPADPFIANAHGYAQLRAGAGVQAVETLRRALDLVPDGAPANAVVRNNLALALTATGRSAEAAALLSRIRDTTERSRVQQELGREALRIAQAGGGIVPMAQ